VHIELPFLLLFLLVVRNSVMLTCIGPLKGVLGVSGVLTLSVALSIWLYPQDVLLLPKPDQPSPDIIFLALREVAIGLLIGLPFALIFEILPFVGRMIDTFRGVQFAEQIAPEMGPRDSMLESYGGLFALWIFFEGAYAGEWNRIILRAIEVFPVWGMDGSKTSTFLSLRVEMGALQIFLAELMTTCLIAVLPLIILSFVLELALSVLQKLCTRFHVGVELSLVRAGMGVLFLVLIIASGEQGPRSIHELSLKGFEALHLLFGMA